MAHPPFWKEGFGSNEAAIHPQCLNKLLEACRDGLTDLLNSQSLTWVSADLVPAISRVEPADQSPLLSSVLGVYACPPRFASSDHASAGCLLRRVLVIAHQHPPYSNVTSGHHQCLCIDAVPEQSPPAQVLR